MASDIRPPNPNRVREKVILKPGFHLVDWMRVMKAMSDVSPGANHRRITLAELAEHKSQFDCWTAYKGKKIHYY
jgi:cytochrome b involved in lipid metabolism